MKFNLLYESIINKDKIENAIEALLENINEFDDSDETLPMLFKKDMLQTRFDMVKTQKLTHKQQNQIVIAQRKAENMKSKEDNKKSIKIPQKDAEKFLNEIDKALIQTFGSWWKSHVLKRQEFKLLLKQFKKEHPNVAMPLELSDFTESEL